MADSVIQNTFKNVYRDDYRDSDNYYQILFNSGRALQQRELNQLQTILNQDQRTSSQALFREGGAALGGEIRVNNKANFIKLNTTTTPLPTNYANLEGEVFAESVSGIRVRVEKVVPAESGDPATLFVSYIDNNGETGSTTPIRVTPGRSLLGETSGTTLTIQTTNTTANPAIGFGCLASVNSGKFFVNGHFVFTPAQNIVLAKYETTPSDTIGFIVSESIVTANDDENLFDNSGVNLNRAAPGADRYRITLTLTRGTDVTAGQYYIKLGEVDEGRLSKDANEVNSRIGTIKEVFYTYQKEQAGNYAVRNFTLKFYTYSLNDDKIIVEISDGKAYIAGERIHYRTPHRIMESKPRTTETLTDQNSFANYGNYIDVSSLAGAPAIDTFATANLRSAASYGGSIIGTARVRHIEPLAGSSNHRIYLFDIEMNAGQNFGAVRSIGTGTTYSSGQWNADIVIGSIGVAVLENKEENNLFFKLPYLRPKTFSNIELTVQKKTTGQTTDGAGAVTIAASAGHVFADTALWVVVKESDGSIASGYSITNNGATADITGLSNATDYTFITYQTKSTSSSTGVKLKTLTNATSTITPEASNDVKLGKADIYRINEIRDGSSTGNVITYKYTLDNGQRDNYYGAGKLILKQGQTAPSGDVYVDFDYFAHGASGDFFCAQSYAGQVDYKDIPNYRQANGESFNLRDMLDFRSRKSDDGTNFTSTGAVRIPLPRNTEPVNYDEEFYLGVKGRTVISREGWWGNFLSEPAVEPVYPSVPGEETGQVMEIAKWTWYPYMISDADMEVSYIDNRRYTMRDIGVLDQRITDLEEVTSLTLLELDAKSIEVLDSDGLNRFKSGITADPFNDHSFSDTTLDDYRASVDMIRGEVRPLINRGTIELVYDSDLSTDTLKYGDNVYPKFTHTVYKQQETASRSATVNPFEVQRIGGTLKLSPSSDNWVDEETLPEKIIPNTENYISSNPELDANSHNTNWSGIPVENETSPFGPKIGDVISTEDVYGDTYKQSKTSGNTKTTTTYKKRSRKTTKVVAVGIRRENLGTVVRDQHSIPYARAKFISFKATGLKPNTQYFPFVNGVLVDDYVNAVGGPSGFVFFGSLDRNSPYLDAGTEFKNTFEFPAKLGGKTTVITDGDGTVSGYIMIPNNSDIRIPSGKIEILLNDVSLPDTTIGLSSAKAVFESAGILREIQDEILTTRVVQTTVETTPLDPELVNRKIIDVTPPAPPYYPPATTITPVQPSVPIPTPKPVPTLPPAPAIEFSCFTGDTMIIMADYTEKKISEIKIGDKVLSGKCKDCGGYHSNTVNGIETPKLGNRKVYGFNGKKPFVSEEHPIKTASGWAAVNVNLLKEWEWHTYDEIVKEELKDIKDLSVGDELVTIRGNELLKQYQMVELPAETQLYNLLLDGDNTYFANDIMVHNKCGNPGNATGCGAPGSGSCFVAGTMVTMADGTKKKIEDIQIGEQLLGHNGIINTVKEYDHRPLDGRNLVGFNGGKPFVTPEHPLYTKEGWKSVNTIMTLVQEQSIAHLMVNGDLAPGDEILMEDGSWFKIETIDQHSDQEEQQVFNFFLDGNNTYYVDGMLAHNKGDGGKVICTALYHMGMLPEDIFMLDNQFGLHVGMTDPALGNGYRLWARPVAEYIKGNSIGSKIALSVVRPLATAWAEEMAHIMKPEKYKSNLIGKGLMAVGHPVCRMIGNLMSQSSNLIKGNK